MPQGLRIFFIGTFEMVASKVFGRKLHGRPGVPMWLVGEGGGGGGLGRGAGVKNPPRPFLTSSTQFYLFYFIRFLGEKHFCES